MKIKTILTIIFLLIIYMYVANITLLPENIIVFENGDFSFKLLPGIKYQESIKTFSLEGDENLFSTIDIWKD